MTGLAVNVPATFTSNVPAFVEDHRKAVDKALQKAAEPYRSAVEARLSLGYKSGVFKTGKVAGSVEIGKPTTRKGTRIIRVGTRVFYARFWEFGFLSRFSRQWERVPVWRSIAATMRQRIAMDILQSYKSMMTFWRPTWKPGRSHKRSKR